jgi:hypothetical protein
MRERSKTGHNHNPVCNPRHVPGVADWRRYEELKAKYTAESRSPKEYEAACRRAAEEAGV